jgi:SMODS and SLOG-associating 2TM effector domain 1
MTERARQALLFYREGRLNDQIGYYEGAAAEYQRANAQSVAVGAVLLSVTSLAGALAGLDIAGKLGWAVVAAVLPALSTALAAYDALYGFDRIGKLYVDAVRSMRRVESPDLASARDAADAAAKVAAYATAVETILRNEQSQWGQLTAKIHVTSEGADT